MTGSGNSDAAGGQSHPQQGSGPAPIQQLQQFLPKGATALPRFAGNPDDRTNAAAFVYTARSVFQLTPGLPELYKITAVQQCFPLGSPANSWFLVNFAEFASFDDFSTRFVARFGVTDTDARYMRREFQTARQATKESVSKWHARLVDLTTRLHMATRTPVPQEQVIERFEIGLKPPLDELVFRERVRSRREYTLDELVKLAEDFESDTREASRVSRQIGLNATSVDLAVAAHSGRDTGLWCAYHKTNTHSTDNCKKVAALKAQGLWGKRKVQPKGKKPKPSVAAIDAEDAPASDSSSEDESTDQRS